MSKTKMLSKVLALVIMLALVLTILPFGAMAAGDQQATFNFPATLAVRKATVSASGGGNLKIMETIGPVAGKNKYECKVELSPSSTTNAVLIALRDSNGDILESSTETLPNPGTITKTLTHDGYSYVFTIVREPAYANPTDDSHVYLDMPDYGVSLGSCTTSTSPFLYPNATTAIPGFPQTVSLRIVPGGSQYDSVTNISVATNTGSTASLSHVAGTFYLASFPSSGSVLKFNVSFDLDTSKAHYSENFEITLTYNGTEASGGGIYAYLPAPGQYTNEGCNTGSWGDAFVTGSTGLKDLVDNVATTGVTLGYFGGYVVLDLGTRVNGTQTTFVPVANTATHPYGVDFIVYGNAFSGNSEPGCIQVAQGVAITKNNVIVGYEPGDANNDGVTWYDIAGSLHYAADTAWNASYVYENPHCNDDQTAIYPTSGTTEPDGVDFTFTPALNGVTSGTVIYNNYHPHSWFPLYANYFVARTGFTAMDKTTVLPFANYARVTSGGNVTSTHLTLKGVRLGSADNTATENYTFGYADVHPNGNSTNYGVASNPYAATANTEGGDGIDISWAVYPAYYDTGSNAGTAHPNAGQPVTNLNNIYFIRIYTGAAAMNPNSLNGEISTEVRGVYVVSGTSGTGNTTDVSGATLSVTGVSNPVLASTITSTNTFTVPVDTQITISYTSSGNTVFINENSGSGSATLNLTLGDGEVRIIRVIAKDSTTGLPYIGFMKLVGSF